MRRKNIDNVRVLYFYAYWDGREELKIDCNKVCKRHKVFMKAINCEDPHGVNESIRWKVRTCPTVLVLDSGREIYRGHGSDARFDMEAIFGEYESGR